ncbi:hypothetical protein ES705_34314 [subsurface metagenome]
MNEIYYIYPKYKNLSFTSIARAHIAGLKPRVKIQEIDEEVLDHALWLRPRNILLHPTLYVTIGDRKDQFKVRQERLSRCLKVKGKLGGFETADTNQIGKWAVNTVNKLDVLFLPSDFAMRVFKSSGVKIPLFKIPHGLSDIMMSKPDKKRDIRFKDLLKIKRKNQAIFVLFFCLHSEYRKGADLVCEAMEFVQGLHKDVYLILKTGEGDNQSIRQLSNLKTIKITSWLSELELKQLYDICDILIVPSRGGGFEMNAIEGIARGLPTIVPDAGCFKDYVKYAIPVPILKRPTIFPDNPIHIGTGWECTPDFLADTINKTITNLDEEKEKAKGRCEEIKNIYDWDKIVDRLYNILRKYGFCD